MIEKHEFKDRPLHRPWPSRCEWNLVEPFITSWPGATKARRSAPMSGTDRCGWPLWCRLGVGLPGAFTAGRSWPTTITEYERDVPMHLCKLSIVGLTLPLGSEPPIRAPTGQATQHQLAHTLTFMMPPVARTSLKYAALGTSSLPLTPTTRVTRS